MPKKLDCTKLLKRVFSVIADSHFNDYKMIEEYCTNFRFKRDLGADIASYIQSADPEYFNKLKEKFKNGDE